MGVFGLSLSESESYPTRSGCLRGISKPAWFAGMAFPIAVFFVLLFAGWTSNSKYAFLGGCRSAAGMVSYELPMTMVVLTLASLVRDGGGRGISLRAGDGRGGFISLRA